MVQRHTIAELVTRYSLYPSMADVYVEGRRDYTLLRWFLKRAAIGDASVYEIDAVDVPDSLVLAEGLSTGRRGRVITLARILGEQLRVPSRRLTFIADSDEDFLLRSRVSAPRLIYTDFTSMDLYLFNETTLSSYLHLVLDLPDLDARTMIQHIVPVLTELFLVRAAMRADGLNVRRIDFEPYCAMGSHHVDLDVPTYVSELLTSRGLQPNIAKLQRTASTLRAAMGLEPRHYIHGDDFVRIIKWYTRRVLKKQTVQRLDNEELLLRVIYGCADFAELSHQPLFRHLARRLA